MCVMLETIFKNVISLVKNANCSIHIINLLYFCIQKHAFPIKNYTQNLLFYQIYDCMLILNLKGIKNQKN